MSDNLHLPSDYQKVYLLLGSNLGKREAYLDHAIALIQESIGNVFAVSAVYETEAWGKTDQPGFLNLAIGVNTQLSPMALLHGVLAIEAALGRVRHEKWGARLIDIDIIFYADQVIDGGAELQIPHPALQDRKFVLQPLAEIAADLVHPILNQSVSAMLANLNDSLSVVKR